MTVPYHHHAEAGVRWVSAASVMRATQATEGLFEVLWGGRLKGHPASVDGMVEGEAPGVERLTPDEGLPAGLPSKFKTSDIAASFGRTRGFAQKVAYCLKNCGSIKHVAMDGNAFVYRRTRSRRKRQS